MPTTEIDHTPSRSSETITEDTDRRLSVRLSSVTNRPFVATVQGVAYQGAITALAGAAGSGKSTLARQMAAAVTVGAPDWLSGEADPDKAADILWIGGEESPAAVRAGFDRLDVAVDLARVHYARIDDVQRSDDLVQLLIETMPELILVDPAADLLRVRDWNAYAEVRGAVRRWAWAVQVPLCNFGLLMLHHMSRRGSYLGSAGLAGAVDLLLELNEAPGGARELRAIKSRVPNVAQGSRMRLEWTGQHYRLAGGAPSIEAPSVERRLADDETARVRAYLLEHPGASKRAIGAAFGVRPGGGRRWAALSAAVEAVKAGT